MKLQSKNGKVKAIYYSGKDRCATEMSIEKAQSIIGNGEFEVVDGMVSAGGYSFAVVEDKPKKTKKGKEE